MTTPLVTGRQRTRARKLVTVLGDNLRRLTREAPRMIERQLEETRALLRDLDEAPLDKTAPPASYGGSAAQLTDRERERRRRARKTARAARKARR